jgi:WD40 repeat protein
LSAQLRHDARIMGIATSRDGAFLATTALDNTTRIWNSADGHEVIRFATAPSSTLLGFDPSGIDLLVASEGGVSRLSWRTSDLVATACAHLTRNLTTDEWRRFLPNSTYAATCPGTRNANAAAGPQ